MRKIKVTAFVSLDGVMQAPGGPEEDPTGGFEHGGWSVNYWDDKVMPQEMTEFMERQPMDLLLGRKTYEIFASFWPNASDEEGAGPIKRATKYVVTTTLDKVDWQPTVLLKGDAVDEIRKLKESDGPELQVHGSANLIQTLLKNELIDELHLLIFPVVIGKGKRLFDEGTVPGALKLVDTKVAPTGVIIATYQPAGAINYGAFGS
jgi:dihydrofolate reductase